MAQSVIVKLTDDLDGSDATETIQFALDGKNYQIDLNKKNAEAMRKAFHQYIEAGRSARQSPARSRSSSSDSPATLFSRLNSEEKDRFRAWANLPTARRIADARVEEWTKAGRP